MKYNLKNHDLRSSQCTNLGLLVQAPIHAQKIVFVEQYRRNIQVVKSNPTGSCKALQAVECGHFTAIAESSFTQWDSDRVVLTDLNCLAAGGVQTSLRPHQIC